MKEHTRAILNSYSEIFFIQGPLAGGLLLLVTIFNPHVAGSGLVAVISAYLFARLIHLDKEFLKSGFYTYNPLLVGFSIGYLFKLTPLAVFFIVTSGIFAFVLTLMLFSIFSYYLRLPILSLPFAIVSSFVYLASLRYSNLFVNNQYANNI